MNKSLYGARASVKIKFEGDIAALAARLKEILELHELDVEHDEDPPHDLKAMGGALGFTVWLKRLPGDHAPLYELSFATGHSHREMFEDRMHDLSPWLARYLAEVGQLVAEVDAPEGLNG